MIARGLAIEADHQNISNLTSSSSAPGEVAISSTNVSSSSPSCINACNIIASDVNLIGNFYPQHPFASPHLPPPHPPLPPKKKKRSLPGNPDPSAEVIALSPKSLLATNRFVCEVCNKGFQRDQNLQLHMRGHNLPWKLKQRPKDQPPKKKVYICPEPTCAHHEPSRALGDLTGIKKHFFRKHGEKKWKCDKCSKRYAVQSDWKAHSKICGTREYRCDCGTIFSRRDSFITHRAFCDAIAGEKNFPLPPQPPVGTTSSAPPLPFRLKKETQQSFSNLIIPNLPPWLSCCPQPNYQSPLPPPPTQSGRSPGPSGPAQIELTSLQTFMPHSDHENPNLSHGLLLSSSSSISSYCLPPFLSASASAAHQVLGHMSATGLLQKAAEMGVSMRKQVPVSSASSTSSPPLFNIMSTTVAHHQAGHVSANGNTNGHAGLTSSREQASSLAYYSHDSNNDKMLEGGNGLNDMMMMSSFSSSFSSSSASSSSLLAGFEDTLMVNSGMIDPGSNATVNSTGRGGAHQDGMTRDFLGLRSFSQKELLNMAREINHHHHHHGDDQRGSFPYDEQNSNNIY